MRYLIAVLLFCSLVPALFGSATDVYITQNGAGAKDGTSLANAGACDAVANTPQATCAFFNNAANWGAGAAQIGAGTTVHLSGTITAAQSTTASYLDFQGSGASGNPITLLFDSGAVLTSPAFWIAIDTASESYITIDGGANGAINNTANGTSLTFHQSSEGVHLSASFFVEVRNLTIQNIYQNQGNVNTATDTAGAGTEDIRVDANNGNITIDGNTVSNARTGIDVAYTTSMASLHIYNNTSSDHAWGIRVVENTAGATSSDIQIHDNTITNWTNWQWPSATYHTDGVIVYGQQNSDLAVNIYNNYIHGDLGAGSPTAFIFCTYGNASPGATCSIFNNLLVDTTSKYAIWVKAGTTGNQIYNNTILSVSSSFGKAITAETATTKMVVKNNIIGNWGRAYKTYAYGNGTTITTSTVDPTGYITASNNVVYNVGAAAEYKDCTISNGCNPSVSPLTATWATWTANPPTTFAATEDGGSSSTDPALDSNYKIQSKSSSAYGLGANLTSTLITSLDTDKAGNTRPASGTWDAGAYQYVPLSAGGGALGTDLQQDVFGGLIGASCSNSVSGPADDGTAQLHTTSSSAVTAGTTTSITLASTSETNMGSPLGSTLGFTEGVSANEYLVVDAGNGTVLSTSESALVGAACSTSYPSSYQTGNHCWTGHLKHASYIKNTLTVTVNGSQVAVEKYGAIDSSNFGGLGQVTGHVTADSNDSEVWVSLAFASVPAAPPVINYSYIPAEVVQVSSVVGNTVTFKTPLLNAHTIPYNVASAYFRTTLSGSNWVMCDPLGFVTYPIFVDSYGLQSNVGQDNQAGNTVSTTLSAAITTTLTPVALPLTSTSTVIPGEMLRIGGSNQTINEWVLVTGSVGNLTATFAKTHNAGEAVECCAQSQTKIGKYDNDATWGTLLKGTPNVWQYLTFSRMEKYGYTGTGITNSWPMNINVSGGLNDLPDHSPLQKVPYVEWTQECLWGATNSYGYSPDLITSGNPSKLGGSPGHIMDYFDANLYKTVAGSANWFTETPWLLFIEPNQTDNCFGLGEGEHYKTWEYGLPGTATGQGFQAGNIAPRTLVAPPYVYVSPQDVAHKDGNGNSLPITADSIPNKQSSAGFLSKTTALPQYLQGQLDPIKFPTAASGNNIASISCSGSNAIISLQSSWLGSHFDPFTVGSLVTVSGFLAPNTGYNTASGVPAVVTTAVQGSHQITVAYPSTNPCPGGNTVSNAGLVALGPGYTSVASLNTAWGSSYATFGSNGAWHQNIAEAGAGNCGGTTACSFPVTAPIDPYSVTIIVWNETPQNTCDLTDAKCAVIAADEPVSVVAQATNGTGPYNGVHTPVTTDTGEFHALSAFTTTLKTAITSTGVQNIFLNAYSSATNPAFPPGSILFFNDGASSEYVRIASINHQPGQITTDSIVSLVPVSPGFSFTHASGISVSVAFPATTVTTAFTYLSAATVTATLSAALPAGWTLTLNYHGNGWGTWTSNPGLLDEDGRSTEQAWLGTDSINGCLDPNTQSNCNSAATGTNSLIRDLDGFNQEMVAYYRRNYLEAVRPIHPHLLQVQDYRGSGGKGDPGRQTTIHANVPYVDIAFVGNVYAGYLTSSQNLPVGCVSGDANGVCTGASTAEYPCLSSGSWTMCKDYADDSYSNAIRWIGDWPVIPFYESDADADSTVNKVTLACCNGGASNSQIAGDYNATGLYDPGKQLQNGAAKTQADRANYMVGLLNAGNTTDSITGHTHMVGLNWWSSSDTPTGGQFDNYGFTNAEDNFYDGVEACNYGTQSATSNVAGYPLVAIPENTQLGGGFSGTGNCYGDFVDTWATGVFNLKKGFLPAAVSINRYSHFLNTGDVGTLYGSTLSLPYTFAGITGNNTSACTTQSYCTAAFAAMSNSADAGAETVTVNPAPGNVSTLDIHGLVRGGAKVIAHSVDWFTSPGSGDHTQTKYNSNDANTVKAQDNDMIARGFDGRVTDWYSQFNTTIDGAFQKIKADLETRCSAPQNCPLEFAAVEDQGAVTRAQGSRAGCSTTDATCIQTSIMQDLCYLNGTDFGSNAYWKMNPSTHAWATSTNPVVLFFPPSTTTGWNTALTNIKALVTSNGWAATQCPAGQQGANGGLILVDIDTQSVTNSQYMGGGTWIDPLSWSSSNQLLWNGTSNNYHDTFYSNCNANTSDACIGSAKKGFDDWPNPNSSPTGPFASWGSNRIMAQQCGQVWLNSLAKSSLFSGNNLTVQLATWNDYEEGSEIETGIDSCYRMGTPTLSNGTLSWSAALSTNDNTYAPVSGGQPTNGTADHWRIWYCNGSNNCNIAADNIPLSTLSQGLATIVPLGTWNVYVQLVGENSILNQISAAVSYTH